MIRLKCTILLKRMQLNSFLWNVAMRLNRLATFIGCRWLDKVTLKIARKADGRFFHLAARIVKLKITELNFN